MAKKAIQSRKMAAAKDVAANPVFQFMITLRGTSPPIWRRIQVEDGSLDDLHADIQAAMGWTNTHLHHFEIRGEIYGDPAMLEDSDCADSLETTLAEILPKNGRPFRFTYTYDFGDNWEHEIRFEGRKPKDPKATYPLCLEGKRACPPEDVGGVWGYEDFLQTMADGESDERKERLEWSGPFDPDEFDADQATKAMRRTMPRY